MRNNNYIKIVFLLLLLFSKNISIYSETKIYAVKNTVIENNILGDKETNDTQEITVEKIISILKDIFTILGLLVGTIFGFLVISRNIKQDTIKDILFRVKDVNDKIVIESQEIIDEYTKIRRDYLFLTKKDVESILQKCIKLNRLAYKSISEIANIGYIIKETIQKILKLNKRYNEDTNISAKIIDFLIYGLDNINMHAIQQVAFPSILNIIQMTKKLNYYNKRIKKYAKIKDFRVYTFISIGIDIDFFNPVLIEYQAKINNIDDPLFYLSYFRIFSQYHNVEYSIVPIVIMMNLEKIYFPPIIESKYFDEFQNKAYRFYLVGYNRRRQLGTNQVFYKFYYATEREYIGLSKNLKQYELTKSNDVFIKRKKEKNFEQNGITYCEPDMFCINVIEENVKKYYQEEKRKIKKKLLKMKKI